VAERPTYFPHTIDIEGVGCVAMILEMYGSGDDMVCGIYQMCGYIHVPPKAWLRVVREQMRLIEQMAKESGVTEMRVAGRSWARVLPDYEPFSDRPNGLRKRLT
jgi:hypothetical protein